MINDNAPTIKKAPVMPESLHNAPDDDCEYICIKCQLKGLQEGQENLAAEVYDLTQTVSHLIRMLGGK